MCRRRDGRFKIGDEIVNVNGKSLRGLTMEDATYMLRSSCCSMSSDIDVILARETAAPHPQQAVYFGGVTGDEGEPSQPLPPPQPPKSAVAAAVNPTPVERRRRRKLPLIERPRSAPIHATPESFLLNRVSILN